MTFMTGGHSRRRGRPRSKPPEERREEFLEAALELFAEQGYDATSVEEICRSVGVAKGTFYLYFRNKEALALVLRERFVEEGRARLMRLVEGWEGPLDGLIDAAIDLVFDFHYQNRSLFDLFYRRFPNEFGPGSAENRRRYVEPMARLIESAAARGEADAGDDPALFAYLIFGAVEENLYSCMSFGIPEDPDALRRAAKTFVRKALAPRPQ